MREAKIGDLVMYKCASTGETVSGLIADIFEDGLHMSISALPMYEVISMDPPDRVWLASHEFSVISCSRS